MNNMTKQLTIKDSYNIEKIKDMTSMATVLKNHVVSNKLYTPIKGKNYVHVEGWQFAGGMMGLTSRIVAVHNLSNEKEIKWRADVEIVQMRDGKVVANGFALCSNKEAIKKGFDEYAVLSMAQTRAVGKGYRNLIGWVMKLAGMEATPSEEMHKGDEVMKEPTITMTEGVDIPAEHETCSFKDCGKEITTQEAFYSKKMFGKKLCRAHQKDAKTKK